MIKNVLKKYIFFLYSLLVLWYFNSDVCNKNYIFVYFFYERNQDYINKYVVFLRVRKDVGYGKNLFRQRRL